MGIVKVLPKYISEFIAAGEVIERPASIVKELIENSIDAKATRIILEIKSGGIEYIKVSDNGVGILKEDMPNIFLRHATSKIYSKDDLDCIDTLGFRGEAMSSISAVSIVEVVSKTIDSLNGYKIKATNDVIGDISDFGSSIGTTMFIKDLFYNIPVRKKFLKNANIEGGYIRNIIEKLALSNPSISFKFIKDKKTSFHTPGDNNLLSSIRYIYGKENSEDLIEVDYTEDNISVKGYISNINFYKSSRNYQNIFINNRYVKSSIVRESIEEAYGVDLPSGKYPVFILNIKIDSSTIDVNIHPTKIEVRFSDEKSVYNIIYFAIKSAIKKDNKNILIDTDTPSYISRTSLGNKVYSDKQYIIESPTSIIYTTSILNDHSSDFLLYAKEKEANYITDIPILKSKKITNDNLFKMDFDIVDNITDIREDKLKNLSESINVLNNIVVLGEILKTYVIIKYNNKLFIIDKHAAHERIIYENLKKEIFNNQNLNDKQILLIPVKLLLSSIYYQIYLENKNKFDSYGFGIESLEEKNIIINSIPSIFIKYDVEEIFYEILKNIKHNKRDIFPDIFMSVLHSISCRSAIKANDENDSIDLKNLFLNIINDDCIRKCPHGRPILIEFDKLKLEKMFGRKK
ncbi:MAG: DNA mismatch repair endonuclease MutL [Oscillospiraceae bacterium]|nr:DNA mismatch repair endonuclease MutL [Oscillospiraceae bacterium]